MEGGPVAVRVRCPSCGTEQELAEGAESCGLCGQSLDPASPSAPRSARTGRFEDPGERSAGTDVFEVEGGGSLTEHAATLPEEAPAARFEEIEAIEVGAKSSISLLALVPVWGLWRIWRSTVHTPREKALLAFTSILVTAAMVIAVRASLPSPQERLSETHLRVRDDVATLRQMVEQRRAAQGSYPDAEEWAASARNADLRFYDPWGRVYRYEREGDQGFRIGTYGRDGAAGGSAEDGDVFESFAPSGKTVVAAGGHRHVVLGRGRCPAIEISEGVVELHGQLRVNASCSPPETAIGIGAGSRLQVEKGTFVAGPVSIDRDAISPAPESGAPVVADPLAGAAHPIFDGTTFLVPMNRARLEIRHGKADAPSTLVVDEAETLSPGVYWGGIRVVSGGSATLESGVYVLAGGGFVAHGTATVNGRGVVLYNTLDPVSPGGLGGFDEVRIADTASVALSAPASEPYRGIVVFQDRTSREAIILGGDLSGFDGVVYAAAADVRLHGPKGLRADLIAGRLTTQSSFSLLPPTQILSGG
jgi:hypothetical protein